MWCDCKIGKMWKNSMLSNPILYTPTFPVSNPCMCHLTHGSTGACTNANYGEMESVTCHLCTPQNQAQQDISYLSAHYPCTYSLL